MLLIWFYSIFRKNTRRKDQFNFIQTLKPKLMKKYLVLITLVLFGLNAFAQQANDYVEISREVLKTEKKAIIAELMQLSEEESAVFWPLYNEFQNKMYEVNTRKVNLIMDFADNFDNMSDEKATEVINTFQSLEMELLKLDKTYAKKFLKILPAQKALRYLQAENKIENLVNAQLALDIPLLESIED